MTLEYSTTGQAGDYLTNSAPESTHQSAQRLFGSYYASVPYHNGTTNNEQITIATLVLLSVAQRNVSLRPPDRLITHYSLIVTIHGQIYELWLPLRGYN